VIHAVSGPMADSEVMLLVAAVNANRDDPAPRGALADRLDEINQPIRAAIARWHMGLDAEGRRLYPVPEELRSISELRWRVTPEVGTATEHAVRQMLGLFGSGADYDRADRVIMCSSESFIAYWHCTDRAVLRDRGFAVGIDADTLDIARRALTHLLANEPLLRGAASPYWILVGDGNGDVQPRPNSAGNSCWESGGSWYDRYPGSGSFASMASMARRLSMLPDELVTLMLDEVEPSQAEGIWTARDLSRPAITITCPTALDAWRLFESGMARHCELAARISVAGGEAPRPWPPA
jgi:hypothetical protein